jgi:hypothetical protein
MSAIADINLIFMELAGVNETKISIIILRRLAQARALFLPIPELAILTIHEESIYYSQQ